MIEWSSQAEAGAAALREITMPKIMAEKVVARSAEPASPAMTNGTEVVVAAGHRALAVPVERAVISRAAQKDLRGSLEPSA